MLSVSQRHLGLLVLAMRRGLSSDASQVSKQLKLSKRMMQLLVDRNSCKELLERNSNVKIDVRDGKVVVHGEAEAVESALRKLDKANAKFFSGHEVEKILTNLIGTPTIVPLGESKTIGPKLKDEQVWFLQSKPSNSLFIWGVDEDVTQKAAERMKSWTPLLDEKVAKTKDWNREVDLHPSSRWTRMSDVEADTDTYIRKFTRNNQVVAARIWSINQENADKAAEILTRPITKGDMEPYELTLAFHSPEHFEVASKAIASFINAEDPSVKLEAIGENKIKLNTIWAPHKVLAAFQMDIYRAFRKSNAYTVQLNNLSQAKIESGSAELASALPGYSSYVTDIITADKITSFVTIAGDERGKVHGARIFFECPENHVKLIMPGLQVPNATDAIPLQLLRKIRMNVLNWPEWVELKYWGGGYFSALANTPAEKEQLTSSWSRITTKEIDSVGALIPADTPHVAAWVAHNGKILVMGENNRVDEFISQLKSSSKKKHAHAKTSADATAAEPVIKVSRISAPEVAKVSRISPPAPAKPSRRQKAAQAPDEEEVSKVTRISFSDLDETPAKVTRISPRRTKERTKENERRKRPLPSLGEGMISTTVQVPQNVISRVVGKQGAVLRGIESKTQARVALRLIDGEEKFFVYGMPDAVESAKEEIESIVDNIMSTPQAGSREKKKEQPDSIVGRGRNRRRMRTAKVPIFSPAYRDKIWETYKSNPAKWSETELCKEFNITPEHLRIIKFVMQKREDYIEKNKDSEELVSKELEETMVRKCGESLPRLRRLRRPICKSHFRFEKPGSELAEKSWTYASPEAEQEERKKEYLAKQTSRPAKEPRNEAEVKVASMNGFRVTFRG